jgi:mono/diheme cytochrome c family protein
MQTCNQCHVGGASGLGPGINDKHLPPFFIRFQVRHGLGAMPAFSDRAISDAQLDDVISYLRYLRQHPHLEG